MSTNIKSIGNFRDLGGIKARDPFTKEAKRIKPHLLLRGEHMMDLTKEDADRLVNEYGLKCVIDLRTTQETIEKPDQEIPGVEHLHIPILTEAMAGISKEKGTDAGKVVQEADSEEALLKAIPDLVPLYSTMVREPSCVSQMTKVLKETMQRTSKGETVFFHCTGGKDRTGIVASLLETMLGVPKKDIMRDYVKTNRGHWGEILKLYYYGAVMRHSPKAGKKLAICFLAHPSFLQSTFDTMTKKAPSVRAFLIQEMGITLEDQEAFAKALLE